jgi:hypothetical protein
MSKSDKQGRSILILFFVLLFSVFAVAQIDTPPVPPEQDLGDLFQRAAASRFVVIGTIVKSRGVAKRMTPKLVDEVRKEGDLSLTLGGTLYTLKLEKTLCRQADFHVKNVQTNEASMPELAVHIFVPRNLAAYPSETILEGHRYLMFLVVPKEQEEWTTTYQLDPKKVYYRAQGGYRGAVPLDGSNQPVVLEKLGQLCQAVSPSPVADKLSALEKLVASQDPVLEREASLAIKELQRESTP